MKPQEVTRALVHAMLDNDPITLEGGPGTGKTQLMFQAAEKAGLQVLPPLYLGMLNEVDVGGMNYPIAGPTGVRLRRLLDDWLEPAFAATEPTLLLLDEIDKGSVQVQAAAAPLYDLRMCGKHKLPDCVVLMGTANRREHHSGTVKTLVHLGSRATRISLEVDPQAWVARAIEDRIAPELIAFIQAFPSNLDISLRLGFKADEAFRHIYDTGKAFENPRGFYKISKYLQSKFPHDLEQETYTGTIGEGVTELLMTHLTLVRAEVDVAAALSGQPWKFPGKDRKFLGARYAFATGIGTYANAETTEAVLNIAKELWEQREREYAQVVVQVAWQSFRGIGQTPAWLKLQAHPLGQAMVHMRRI